MTGLGRMLAMFLTISVGIPACSGSAGEASRSPLAIELQIGGGQRWSASGESIRAEVLCEEGFHRWVGYRAHGGSPIEYGEAAAMKRVEPDSVLLETQLGCSDGTGWISIAWEPDHDENWIIVGGSGAYAGSSGGGLLTRGTGDAGGSSVTLTGDIARG